MTEKSNKSRNTVLTVVVIAFAASLIAGLAIVPSLQEANAINMLLKNKNNKAPIDNLIIKKKENNKIEEGWEEG